MTRNWGDPDYKKWRLAIYRRDGFKCKWRGCNKTKGLQAHHILPWSSHPALRLITSNGITLCKQHHKLITGQEAIWASYLKQLLEQ